MLDHLGRLSSGLLSKMLRKFGYIKVMSPERTISEISDDALLQALIFDALMSGIDMKSPAKEEHLQDIARGVVFKLRKMKALSLEDFLKTVENPVFISRQITFAIGAGTACYWETQVKQLAQQLGLDIYETTVRANAKSPALKDIEPIIDEIKASLPRIDFKFGRLINLRNAIVHGNFHQIRTAASESRSNASKESFKGRVMMASLADSTKSLFLSEKMEFDQIKEVGLFGWFLDTGNSALFESVIQEFQDGIFLINSIVHFKSLSFKEHADLFKSFCVNGTKLTDKQKDQFVQARAMFDQPKGLIAKQFKAIEKVLK